VTERTRAVATAAAVADTSIVQGVLQQVARRVVGQEYMVERLLISLLTGGHVLLEGVPGLAKTLTVRTLAETISTTFHRIQFTPDLLPADVLGTQVFDQSRGSLRSSAARSSPTSSSPTRSTARRPRSRPRCSRPCRRSRSR